MYATGSTYDSGSIRCRHCWLHAQLLVDVFVLARSVFIVGIFISRKTGRSGRIVSEKNHKTDIVRSSLECSFQYHGARGVRVHGSIMQLE
jgi:hypothetical protein